LVAFLGHTDATAWDNVKVTQVFLQCSTLNI